MPFIKRDSYRLYYECTGDGSLPVLVLSHSLGASRVMWQPQLEAFSRSYRLLLYDHPGHGLSDPRAAAGSMEDYGRDVIALMDELRVKRASFCGLSLGGMVGLWLGANAARRFDKLVLCNTTARIADPALLRGRLERLRSAGSLGAIGESVFSKWFTRPFLESRPDVARAVRRMFLTTTAKGYADASVTVCEMDLRPQLGRITLPTLVVYGRYDEATPPEWNFAIADAIPGSRTCALEAAHMSNVEASQEFTDNVLSFLSG